MKRWLLAACFFAAVAQPASAHSAARGFVLLLPTNHVIFGGALAVLISFCAVSLLPDRVFRKIAASQVTFGSRPAGVGRIISFVSALALAGLVWIGFAGPPDPLENLLPLTVWTLWWVVIVLLHPVLGNLWSQLNPLAGIGSILVGRRNGVFRFQEQFAYLPALLIFAGFAWFQLVYPGPEDPSVLAVAVLLYVFVTLLAAYLMGPEQWFGRGDPFAIFMSQLAAVAPLGQGSKFTLRWPGIGLLALPALPIMGTLFVLLTLSSISFDGFANTFLWLHWIGVNPLDYPGRTALMGANTLGLIGSFLALVLTYSAAVAMGWRWSGRPGALQALLGSFVFSLIPISIAFHFAHYLSDALVNLQYLVLALNDPFGSGANLFGFGHYHVTASFQNTASGTLTIFTAQTAAVIAGHIVAVAVAHMTALQLDLPKNLLLRLEAPLAILMVLYTAFGLWLLATPAIS